MPPEAFIPVTGGGVRRERQKGRERQWGMLPWLKKELHKCQLDRSRREEGKGKEREREQARMLKRGKDEVQLVWNAVKGFFLFSPPQCVCLEAPLLHWCLHTDPGGEVVGFNVPKQRH